MQRRTALTIPDESRTLQFDTEYSEFETFALHIAQEERSHQERMARQKPLPYFGPLTSIGWVLDHGQLLPGERAHAAEALAAAGWPTSAAAVDVLKVPHPPNDLVSMRWPVFVGLGI